MLAYQALALLPFFIMFYLLLRTSMKTYKVMMIVYGITLVMLATIWEMLFDYALFSTLRGFLVGVEIFLIIFSVLILFNILKDTGKLKIIQDFLKSFSDDIQIQIILVGFFLVLFFESIAGFGTPAAVCAPLLVYFGVRPLTAVVICLISDTFAVAFGAFGTPILKGIGSSTDAQTLVQIGVETGFILGLVSILVPTVLLLVYSKLENKKISIQKYLPFTITSGLIYGSLLIVTSRTLSLEMPAVVASLISLIVIGTLLKFGVFTKKIHKKAIEEKELFLSLLPYLLIIALFFFKTIISIPSFEFRFNEVISYTLSLTTPGIIIGVIALIFLRLYANSKEATIIVKDSFNQGKAPLYTLLFTLAFVQLLIYSDSNTSKLDSIPYLIASLFSNSGALYILFAPLIGAFGSFMAGSVTVSNIIFTPLQQSAAQLNSLSASLVLTLQTLGGAAGNMVALHNIIAALAVVNVKGGVKQVLRVLIWGVVGLCVCFSIIGYLFFM